MPIVNVQWIAGRTVEQKRQVVERITRMERSASTATASTSCSPMSSARPARGGKLLAIASAALQRVMRQ